jgi:hypothetical protein
MGVNPVAHQGGEGSVSKGDPFSAKSTYKGQIPHCSVRDFVFSGDHSKSL